MDLKNYIKSKKTILLDGGMGTQLIKKGIQPVGTPNITCPEVIKDIQREYLHAGSDIITTNTFILNKIYLETHKMDVDVIEANKAGVNIAKSVCKEDSYVLGDIGLTGQLLEPYGTYTEEQFYNTFKEQAEVMADGGVDGFIIETQSDLRETLCALKACKNVSELPVIVSFTFSKHTRGFVTMMGNFLNECVEKAVNEGADVVGSNCGELDPFEMAEVAAAIKCISKVPIIIQPNAGKPKLVDNKTIYDMSPETFAEGIKKCIEAGASLVGGCCGTTPEHISQVWRSVVREI